MSVVGLELELAVLLVLTTVGQSVFAIFEIETPRRRLLLKWAIVDLATIGLYFLIGHWALTLPILAGLAGGTFHVLWCRKNGIHPIRATPRAKYYALRGWDSEPETGPAGG